MRPEPPPHYRPGPIERLGLHRLLSPAGRIVLRNLERRPLKASLSALGVAFAAAILVVGYFSFDSLEALIDLQFRQVQRDDLTVVFAHPRPAGVAYDLAHLPGVMRVEPFRAVPARVRIGHRSRRVAISGVLPDGRLRRLIDARHHEVRLPSGGAVLTTKLAEVIGARTGDTLTIEILEGARAVRRVAVAGVVDEPIGLSVYMERSALAHLLHEGLTVSGAYLAVDPARMDRLLTRLKELPAVAGSARRGAALKSFNDTIGRSIGVVTTILVLAASAIAVAVIYNSARIALSERARELASLRVLGFTRDETARMLLGEQMVLAAIGTPIGLMLGYGFSWALAMNYQWEMFRIPLVVSSRTYAFAVIVVTLAALATAAVVRRRVHRLDLVSALKTGE
jgi:putative ABC transport system permease protein